MLPGPGPDRNSQCATLWTLLRTQRPLERMHNGLCELVHARSTSWGCVREHFAEGFKPQTPWANDARMEDTRNRMRVEDVAALMCLLEEHATAHPPWRKAARLLFDLVSFCVKERYGGELAVLRARPDWAFLGTPSQ